MIAFTFIRFSHSQSDEKRSKMSSSISPPVASEGETSSCHSDHEKLRSQSPVKSSRINLRSKKNLRLKRRPTGVFAGDQVSECISEQLNCNLLSLSQFNPSSSASEASDCDEQFTASVIRNTLYNETWIDSNQTSTVEIRVEADDDDLEDEEDEEETELSLEDRNQILKNRLRLKELYIKQLEDRINRLERRQTSRDNLCEECHNTLLHQLNN